MSASFRRGLRLGLPFAAVALVLALSFGVLAVQAGFTPVQAVVMSVLVFGGFLFSSVRRLRRMDVP